MTAPALETIGLVKRFGGILATDNLSLKIEPGSRHALIGPNGAGKTTLVNLLTGVLAPNAGVIRLEGEDITRLASRKRVRRGLVRTFQINQLFGQITPLETVALAIGERRGNGANWWRPVGRDAEVLTEARDLLESFDLASVMNEPTTSLPYGKQRLLEIATALACRPRVLLLDEPAAGVPEQERHGILAILDRLPADVTVLLIEHDMDLVFTFAQRISVLVNGALLVEGAPEEIRRDPRVRAVYLGDGGHG